MTVDNGHYLFVPELPKGQRQELMTMMFVKIGLKSLYHVLGLQIAVDARIRLEQPCLMQDFKPAGVSHHDMQLIHH